MSNFDSEHYQKVIKVLLVLTEQSSKDHLLDKRNKLIDNEVKLNYPLLEAFKLIYNVTFQYKIDYCDNFEKCITQKLLSGEADISGYPLLITRENLIHLDFPGISTFGNSKIIFQQPKLSLITNVYTLPFTGSVWLASFGLIILSIIFLFLVSKWQQFKQLKDEDIPDSLLDLFFIAVGAVSQQGTEKEPRGLQGKTITWFFFVTFMFLYAAYSANIVALLQATSTGIQSLSDLMESPMGVGMHNCALYKKVISDIQGRERINLLHEKHIKILRKGEEIWRFENVTTGIEKVRHGMYAFHVETHIGYAVIENTFDEVEKCGLQEMPFFQFPTDLYFPLRKGSPYAEMFKIGFLRLRETGIHNREIIFMRTPKPSCWTLDANFVSVGILDCYFALILYTGGLFLSIGVFFIEVFLASIYRRKQN